MSALELYFNDSLVRTIEIDSSVTTIGRSIESDIQIDNQGVSGNHARIIQEGNKLYAMDAGSTNGTFVNGKKIQRVLVSNGDYIGICKHSLKVVSGDAGSDNDVSVRKDNSAASQPFDSGATVMLKPSRMRKTVGKRTQQERDAKLYLRLINASEQNEKHLLTKQSFTIGKRPSCDVRVSGWFAPAVAAMIDKTAGGYLLIALPRGKVLLNDRPVKGESDPLKVGDRISIRGLKMIVLKQE